MLINVVESEYYHWCVVIKGYTNQHNKWAFLLLKCYYLTTTKMADEVVGQIMVGSSE